MNVPGVDLSDYPDELSSHSVMIMIMVVFIARHLVIVCHVANIARIYWYIHG